MSSYNEDLLTHFNEFLAGPAADQQVEQGKKSDLLAYFDSLDLRLPTQQLTGAQQEEQEIVAQQEARMARAHADLERSYLPGVRSAAVQIGGGFLSPVARLIGKGDWADEMNRWSGAIEQATREREKGGFPDWLQQAGRGALVSFGTAIPAGVTLGPYGAIGTFSVQETDRAITEGRDAGKKGVQLASFAIAKGLMEGVPAAAMQAAGVGGFEKMVFSKGAASKAAATGLREGAKRLGITAVEEFIEENATELGSLAIDHWSGADPRALTPENITRTVAETTAQTGVMVMMGGAPGLYRSMKAGKAAQITEEAVAHAEEEKTPSRRTWLEDWGLSGKYGMKKGERKAFTQELTKQFGEATTEPPAGVEEVPAEQPLVAQEGPGAPDAGSVAAVEPLAGEEVSGAAIEPEAAPEAPGAAEAPIEAEVVPELPEDQTTALTKAAGAQLRKEVGLDELPEAERQSALELRDEAVAGNTDEKALDVARDVLSTRRMASDKEHVAFTLKTVKLKNERKTWKVELAAAVEADDSKKGAFAITQIEEITGQIDTITAASQHSGTEISSAFNIRKLRLSDEQYDIVSVLEDMQAIRGKNKRVTKRQKDNASKLTDEHEALENEAAEIEAEDLAKEEKRERVLAEKTLDSARPKRKAGKVGKGIKERARAEREEIKKQLRALGHRVNDVSGVSAEGLYLVGRLGISYAKEGVGTFIEVAERIRADMPQLRITDPEVARAIISRSPKAQARVKDAAAKRIDKLKVISRLHVEQDNLAKGLAFGPLKRRKVPTDTEIKNLQKKNAQLRHEYFYSSIEASRLERAIEKLDRLQDQLGGARGQLKEEPSVSPPQLEGVLAEIREAQREIRVDQELAKAKEQLKTGIINEPIKKEKKPISQRLELKLIELDSKKREIQKAIVDSSPWGPLKVFREVIETPKTLITTGEISFALRQNNFQMRSHPIRGVKAIGRSIVAAFDKKTADKINFDLRNNSKNSAIYAITKLPILDSEAAADRERAELYRAHFVKRVPVLGAIIRASERNAAAVSNIMRTKGMDQFLEQHPNATRQELNAWADYQATVSGIGSLWKLAQAGNVLRDIFFSPKFSISRAQSPFKVLQYWKLPRVRNAIAIEMARTTGTALAVLSGFAASGMVVFDDPDDADFLKIRIGNTRFDILGGSLQPFRVVARIMQGATAAVGLARESSFGIVDPRVIFGRFAAFKLSPLITIPADALMEAATGKTKFGEEATIPGFIARNTIMLFLQDVYEATEEYRRDSKAAAAAGGVGALVTAGTGIGVSTYVDSPTAVRRKMTREYFKNGVSPEFLRLRTEHNRRAAEEGNKKISLDWRPKK